MSTAIRIYRAGREKRTKKASDVATNERCLTSWANLNAAEPA